MASDLIPADALQEVRAVLEHGAGKWGAAAWETDGRPALEHVQAADRHIQRWWPGHGAPTDPDSGRHALAHAAARCLLALALELREAAAR